MVVVNDFKFQLVSAEDDNKTPFKEWKSKTKTYVEVEPDAEYFLSIEMAQPSSTSLYCEYYVDGKDLGYHDVVPANHIINPPRIRGIFSRSNSTETMKALKFVKALFHSSNSKDDIGFGSTMGAGMGEIKMKVYQAIENGYTSTGTQTNFTSSFTTSSIDIEDGAFVTMKKNIRSGEGNKSVVTKTSNMNGVKMTYLKGPQLYTIPLNYCATLGLISVGVLPKPPHWDYQRMLKPSKLTAKEKERVEKGVINANRNKNGKEVLELNDSSDDDSDNEDGVGDTKEDKSQQQQKSKKMKLVHSGQINI
ncbi:MAG: hypothetical protein ACI8RD_001413 [Bacillariaceae sp.]|jgi:hypothetical protein